MLQPSYVVVCVRFQPWYEFIDSIRCLLSDEEAKDKLTGDTWHVKLLRQADRTLELLDLDRTRFQEEMSADQGTFLEKLDTLAGVSHN